MKTKRSKKGSGKKIFKLSIIIAAFLALLAAAGYTVFIAPLLKKEQWVYKEVLVQRGTFTVGVTESGALEYGITELKYELDLNVDDEEEDADGEEETAKYLRIEKVYVAAGERVTAGEPLIGFTQESVAGVRRQLESALVEAKADYNEALAEYDLSALEAKMDYDSALIDAKYASAIYQNALKSVNGDITGLQLELEICRSSVSTLEERLANAQEGYDEITAKYEKAKAAWEAADVSDTVNYMYFEKEYLSAQTGYQNATDQIRQAQQAITSNEKQISELTRQIKAASETKQLNKLDAEDAYQESVLNGENAKIVYDSTIEGLKEELQEAQDKLDEAQHRLDDFEAFVGEEETIFAKGDGIITEVACEEDQSLERAQTLLKYAKPDEMTISVDVTQEDIVNLKVGDKVNITFTAYDGDAYNGFIRSIETTATSRNTNTISYTVVVVVEGDTQKLYGGMTSDIVFVLEEKENVLYVSQKAIVKQNEKYFVYVKSSDGEMVLKEVSVGDSNGVNTEILSGLEEGEAVYLASRVSSQEEVTGATGSSSDSQKDENASRTWGDGSLPDMSNLPDMSSMPDMSNLPDMGSMPDMSNLPNMGGMPGSGNSGRGSR